MSIQAILAVDQGGAVGWSDGRLAYPGLKDDMARFKALTTGHTVVMGFNTFRSLNRPNGLPNRRNIVLTRKPWSEARQALGGGDVEVISSLDWVQQKDEIDRRRAAEGWHEQTPITWLIGGASVYDEAFRRGMVDKVHLTLIHSTCDADVRLETDLVAWKRFVLTERKRDIHWEVEPVSTQQDGDVRTSYITFTRA